MTGHRIAPIYQPEAPRQRRPRLVYSRHIKFVKSLGCAICGRRPVDPAHLRSANRLLGKRAVGVGERPSDLWITPLCRQHHDEQHSMNELQFWRGHQIDPFQLAMALSLASLEEDDARAELIVAEHRMVR